MLKVEDHQKLQCPQAQAKDVHNKKINFKSFWQKLR